MIYVILTLISALSISAVAIYYSVAGLVAIFSAAAIPIIVMGSILEISKLVTAVWLHKFWHQAKWWLKTYLCIAVVILMFITSMGIFGFLSKAHIQQTSASKENIAQIQRIESELDRFNSIVARTQDKISDYESKGTGGQSNIQTQIDKEQSRIDAAYARIQPLVDEQNEVIRNVSKFALQELEKIDVDIAKLKSYINDGEIEKAQGIVGTKADGKYGPATALAFQNYEQRKNEQRETWLAKIENASQATEVVNAKQEITRLRNFAERQIQDSNNLINNLRANLQNANNNDISILIEQAEQKISNANKNIEQLTTEKYAIQGEYRKLEAEVGPIKYIAEFIYGNDTTKDLLEKAVKWIIITIIFVFDPLAVLLLIASQYTFHYVQLNYKKDTSKEKLETETPSTVAETEPLPATTDPPKIFDNIQESISNIKIKPL
jgi:hypothetical protein|tara:strand:+ start:25767 stop:27074 length:1308 start_codon:yes stop_codon:yes gene_type:complete